MEVSEQQPAEEWKSGMVERVAQAIALGAIRRTFPNAQMDFIMRRVAGQWEEYQPDAMLVIDVIDSLVAAEQFQIATEDLPEMPQWLTKQ